MTTRYQPGDRVGEHKLDTITGDTVSVPDPDQVVHLQFRRFAGCPVCHVHLHQVARRHSEITGAGIHEVVVFHSDAALLRTHEADLPFDTVADPDKTLYREFGIDRGLAAALHPRVAVAAVRGMLAGNTLSGAVGRGEDHLSKPADFLIDTDGTVLASHYGTHAADQWSVDQLLELRRGG